LISPESPCRGRPKPSHGRCPPDLRPFKALSVSVVGQDRSDALPCVGLKQPAEAVRAKKANDRTFGGPDPPFPPGPHSLRSEAPGDGRVALASAGRALVGLRGFPEDRGRKVAPYWFGAPGKPFRRRSGLPFRTAGQGPSPLTSPLTTSHAPSGREPKGRRRTYRTDSTLPGFQPLQRMQRRGFGPRGLATPATFRPQRFARSRRLALRGTFRACFIPVALMGFESSGLCTSPGGIGLSRSLVLSCRSGPIFARR
jgi:hypothetical protein